MICDVSVLLYFYFGFLLNGCLCCADGYSDHDLLIILIVQSAVLRINPSTDALIILQREDLITPE